MKIKWIILFCVCFMLVIIFWPSEELPKEKTVKNERYYQVKLCNNLGGDIEYALSDKTRVDCLTKEYAIEVDWGNKWAEGIGQSLFYAEMTHKKPAVALIVGSKDQRYLTRLNKVAKKFGITVFKIKKHED